ncbi:MAG: carboxypeptidase regulatory-like domain-containing protein, partial [Planctomycetes bacterium]|nr:carboxypeptidase regulatory-like domain-containing protein [Planctomycetota bacterium]
VGRFDGRVVDSAGDPVAGARVRVFISRAIDGSYYAQPERTQVTTDEHGDFALLDLPEGYLKLAVFADGNEMDAMEVHRIHRVFRVDLSEDWRETLAEFWPRRPTITLAH